MQLIPIVYNNTDTKLLELFALYKAKAIAAAKAKLKEESYRGTSDKDKLITYYHAGLVLAFHLYLELKNGVIPSLLKEDDNGNIVYTDALEEIVCNYSKCNVLIRTLIDNAIEDAYVAPVDNITYLNSQLEFIGKTVWAEVE